MKPISLTIKGLNSFIEAQEIDFEKLTQQGLFGIFGPTGSGKSTILDGITLALFGEVARKSANFINTNCDSANVSYEFQISGQEMKRYRVEREFRREKKTDAVRTKSAKVVELAGDTEIVLEDGVKSVTSKCEEIIGLKLDDFTRTVVLPQGKFSEFLKLTGKERSEMLERLFNLQKYGDDLSGRLSGKIRTARNNESRLEGELNGYEDCSEEVLNEKQKELKEKIKQFDQCRTELAHADVNCKSGETLWNLQLELEKEKANETELKKADARIAEIQNKVLLGESALKVKPYVGPYEDTLHKMNDSESNLSKLTESLSGIKIDKEEKESAFETARNRKEIELPALKIKEHQVMESIDEKVNLDKLLAENESLQKDIRDLEKVIVTADAAVAANEKNIEDIREELAAKTAKTEELNVPAEYKDRIGKALLTLNDFRTLQKHQDNLLETIRTKSEALALMIEDQKNKYAESNLKTEETDKAARALNDLISNCPGDQDAVLKLSNRLFDVKTAWEKNVECSLVLQKANSEIEALEKDAADKTGIKDPLKIEVDAISSRIRRAETECAAYALREALAEGDICLVCGSREHHLENIEIPAVENLEQVKSELQEKAERFQKLSDEILTAQAGIDQQKKIVQENSSKLLELGEDYKAFSPESLKVEFETLNAAVKKYTSDKESLDTRIKVLTQEKSDLESACKVIDNSISGLEDQLNDLRKSLQETASDLESAKKKLDSLKSELSIEDFESESSKISRMEKEKSGLELEIKELREKLQTAQTLKDEDFKKAGGYKEQLSGMKNAFTEKSKSAEEKRNSIRARAGEIDNLEKLKETISELIKDIECKFGLAEKDKNDITRKYDECSQAIIHEQKTLRDLSDRLAKDKVNLERALAEENMKDIQEIRNHLLTKDEIEQFGIEIASHKESINKIAGTIETLEKKIDGRSLTEEEWNALIAAKKEKTELLETLNNTMIQITENIKTLSIRLDTKKEILKEKEKLDHTLSLLSDLEKLFKGKKFVDFVATNQLKYVSLEACKKLKEITGGNYGLEADENGRFIIRDYKNGGAQRDATTLSGGETFLASLSLALALSAQIQLKGTAPLELFFLDEGFGTLDDNLLETVMDSLEKVHHERLSIGIISHLEAIKNRMPVKLNITPAEAGMGGSKVKIERN
ncbi:AAA family ATPase [Parasporobacterium paucivorans]|uniref:Nuclease SbcCD subunit C n=1 Tax=Parasporobacterium paucivorans DSM 15970 TaxID=1122934 RepID=A0A1M6HY96_9FIRM|nr:SMC family ATPase [Parasporobacterium paucivorans]SHJ27074.1 exonuclease SbcC [Parasporobacterium paucivorans DSM 15970]